MTITEHLRFSVLTAPIASMDRRTLSQAWYSALYGERSSPNAPTTIQGTTAKSVAPRSIAVTRAAGGESPHHGVVPVPRNSVKAQVVPGAETERRAPRSPLARKIERAFLHPKAPARKATFALDGGRVQVMLRAQGSRIKLLAICAPKAKAQVAHALAQARYSLALRGIDLDVEPRERAAC
jgi:hypothetical protein